MATPNVHLNGLASRQRRFQLSVGVCGLLFIRHWRTLLIGAVPRGRDFGVYRHPIVFIHKHLANVVDVHFVGGGGQTHHSAAHGVMACLGMHHQFIPRIRHHAPPFTAAAASLIDLKNTILGT